MRKGRSNGTSVGCAMILLGILILLAMVLPSGFWWAVLAFGLIAGGCCCVRRF